MTRDELEVTINLRSVINRLGDTALPVGFTEAERNLQNAIAFYTQKHMMLYPEVVIDLRDSVVIQSLSRTQAVVS